MAAAPRIPGQGWRCRRPLPRARRGVPGRSGRRPRSRANHRDEMSAEISKLPPLLLLHPDDNILVARRDIAAGESVEVDGESFTLPAAIELGHKLARRPL